MPEENGEHDPALSPSTLMRRSSTAGRDAFHTATIKGGAGSAVTTGKGMDNYVATTKYSMLTFLPKALYEQFRRVANVYFTMVAVLSCTEMSPVSYYTTIPPLVLVIGLSVAKEGYEDWKRYKADKQVNESITLVWRGSSFEPCRWQELAVGELVKVKRGEYFPADLVFLTSALAEGTCYVETMNLDGETNLKIKTCVDATKGADEHLLGELCGGVQCDAPNNSIYTFAGNLSFSGRAAEAIEVADAGRSMRSKSLTRKDTEGNQHEVDPSAPMALGINQLLLRGSSLRNTDFVVGCVVYAGHDTKMMMNSTQAPSKRSQIEKSIDGIIFFMLGLTAVMCSTGAVSNAMWTKHQGPNMWYLDPHNPTYEFDPDNVGVQLLANLITVIILYGYLIPISLYVSVEMVKVVQLILIGRDRAMYHGPTDTPALARTSNLNEELGQVHTILSDKTGTLTCNVMEFFKCSIAGKAYGNGFTEVERSIARRNGRELLEPETTASTKGFNFKDPVLCAGRWQAEPRADLITHFVRMMAVCHTVIPEQQEEGQELLYQAESPDELAFISAATEFGMKLVARSHQAVFVEEGADHKVAEYQVLNVLEFNSDRKRMSVVVRQPDGRLVLYCKGADSVIAQRTAATGNDFVAATMQHAEMFSRTGLRTLVFAFRMLDEEEYQQWNTRYQAARTSLQDREGKMAEVAEDMEVGLTVLGCTAIEDKLQPGVPECIETLMKAGLRLWVLTGDKQETAINIGFACGLLRNEMVQYIVDVETPEFLRLESFPGVSKRKVAQLGRDLVKRQLTEAAADIKAARSQSSALVIDGKGLGFALHEDVRALLLEVGQACASVICCRVSPLQKAQITELVKSAGQTSLAIGDGANDVGMIQQAHIGVGISGQEGRQAVMAADFAIAQFMFLERLLLDHGRWSYKRIGRMISYFFYKNVLFGMSMYWYNMYAFFSGQTIYNDFYMSMYNVCFVCFPIIITGFMDQDVSQQARLQFPGLYRQGQRNEYFNWYCIGLWMLNGIYQSVIIFGVPTLYYTFTPDSNGMVWGLWSVGTTMYTCVILSVNLNLAMVLNYWTWVQHLVIWGTIAAWFVFLVGFGAADPSMSTDVHAIFVEVMAPQPSFWLVCLLTVVLALLPDLVFRAMQRVYFPQDHHIVQEVDAATRKKLAAIPRLADPLPL